MYIVFHTAQGGGHATTTPTRGRLPPTGNLRYWLPPATDEPGRVSHFSH